MIAGGCSDLPLHKKETPDESPGIFLALFCVFDCASFADDVDFNDARIRHGGLDFVGDVASEFKGGKVVDLFRLDDNSDFSASRDGVSLADALERGGDIF